MDDQGRIELAQYRQRLITKWRVAREALDRAQRAGRKPNLELRQLIKREEKRMAELIACINEDLGVPLE